MASGGKTKRNWVSFLCVLLGLIVLLIGMLAVAIYSPPPVPELVVTRPHKPEPAPQPHRPQLSESPSIATESTEELQPIEDFSTTQTEELSPVEERFMELGHSKFLGNSIETMQAIQFRDDAEGVRVCYPADYDQGGWVNFDDVYHIQAGEAAQLPEGIIDIKWIGVGYHTGPSDDLMVDLKHYTPQGEPLDAESIANLPDWAFRCLCHLQGPVLLFGGDLEGIENYRLIDAILLNRWEHRWHPRQSFIHHPSALAAVRTYLWYDTEVDLILNFAHGPIEEYDLPMEPGSMITIDDTSLKILAVSSGKPSNWRVFFQDDSMGECSLGKFFTIDKTATQQTFVAITCSNESHSRLFELAAYDENDAELEVKWVYPEGRIIESPMYQVKRLAIRYWPRRTRLIFTLPGIPGLPVENDDTDNIFQLRIPYLKITDRWDWRSAIHEYTGLMLRYSGGPAHWLGDDILPVELTNTTPNELLVLYTKQFKPRPRIVMDEENSMINLEYPYRDSFMYNAWDAIKETYFFWE